MVYDVGDCRMVTSFGGCRSVTSEGTPSSIFEYLMRYECLGIMTLDSVCFMFTLLVRFSCCAFPSMLLEFVLTFSDHYCIALKNASMSLRI
jgi:hypothetical protein